MNTAANTRKAMPPNWIVMPVGLILIIIRFAYTFFFIWCMCMLGIMGEETVRTNASVIKNGMVSIPDHYYVAAMLFALFFMGFFQLLRTAITTGLFPVRDFEPGKPENKEEAK